MDPQTFRAEGRDGRGLTARSAAEGQVINATIWYFKGRGYELIVRRTTVKLDPYGISESFSMFDRAGSFTLVLDKAPRFNARAMNAWGARVTPHLPAIFTALQENPGPEAQRIVSALLFPQPVEERGLTPTGAMTL